VDAAPTQECEEEVAECSHPDRFTRADQARRCRLTCGACGTTATAGFAMRQQPATPGRRLTAPTTEALRAENAQIRAASLANCWPDSSVPADVLCIQREAVNVVRALSSLGVLTYSESGNLVAGNWTIRVDIAPAVDCPTAMVTISSKADLVMDILDDAGATISMEEPATCYTFESQPPPSAPPLPPSPPSPSTPSTSGSGSDDNKWKAGPIVGVVTGAAGLAFVFIGAVVSCTMRPQTPTTTVKATEATSSYA